MGRRLLLLCLTGGDAGAGKRESLPGELVTELGMGSGCPWVHS